MEVYAVYVCIVKQGDAALAEKMDGGGAAVVYCYFHKLLGVPGRGRVIGLRILDGGVFILSNKKGTCYVYVVKEDLAVLSRDDYYIPWALDV